MASGLPSLVQIVDLPDLYLGQLDIGILNFLCASGLPGAETLDIDRLDEWLDNAARRVDLDTRRHWYRFIDSPAAYHDSPGYFCCYFLLQVLQEEFGVKYNPKRVTDTKFQDPKCFDPDFSDSRDLFIHGIIDGDGGTCCSMPVLYVAVARRLGYPVKLVETRGHLFFRWDDHDGKMFGVWERFNIEGSGSGIAMHPDEHYRTWPEPWTKADEAGGYYLTCLTPREELASFLSARAECLLDNNRIGEAADAYRLALKLVPSDPRYKHQLHKITTANLAESHRLIEDAKRRKQEFLAGGKKPKPVPPHGDYCQCAECKKVREAKSPLLPGHLPDCQCSYCKQKRQPAAAVNSWHGPTCTCRNCKQSRQPAGATLPGHPPGCQCFHCRSQSLVPR
jgi:hypothetical protein